MVLNFLLCLPFYIIGAGSEDMFMKSVIVIMWIPALSSVIIKLVFDKNLKGYGWKPGKIKYLGLGYVIPIIGGLAVYGMVWLTGL